jgi:hypothetical protein
MESTATAAYMDTSATTAMATSAATAMATSAAAAMATSATTATRQFQLLGERGLSAVFPVKRVKRRQAGVEDFLLTEKELVILTL